MNVLENPLEDFLKALGKSLKKSNKIFLFGTKIAPKCYKKHVKDFL